MKSSQSATPWPGPFQPGQRIVGIGAHFDDLELGCGGTVAAAAAAGCQVTFIILTHSGYAQSDGGVRSADLAFQEGSDAAAALGVTDIRCLDFPTARLAWTFELVNSIDKALVDTQPDLIITHWPFDTHQDHHYGSMATLAAARLFPTILTYEPIFPSGRSYYPFRPQAYVDITTTLEAKLEALRRHKSQYAKYGDIWIHAVQSRCSFRGYEAGVEQAEAFEVVRMRCTP